MNFCENCGSKINEGDKFCENCGTPLNKAAQEVNSTFNSGNDSNSGIYTQNTNQNPQINGEKPKKKKSSSVLLLVLGLIFLFFLIVAVAGLAGYFLIYKNNSPAIENIIKEDKKESATQKKSENEQKVTKEESQVKEPEADNKTTDSPGKFKKREKREGDCGDYPELSERKLSPEELTGVSEDEKKYMRNEIYMRHGYIFTDEELLIHFAFYPCYEPKYLNVNKYLTEIEKYNIKLLK